MSVAHSGRLIRNLDQDRLRRVLRTLLSLDQPQTRRQPTSPFFSLGARSSEKNGERAGRAQRRTERRTSGD
jgi:hypothetical protein